jgi:probable phosphoglycerate mutase
LYAIDPDKRYGSIRNGSVHSFAHADGTLELLAFDDPIDVESLQVSESEFEDQNAVEQREVIEG